MFSGATAEPLRALPPHERHLSDHLQSYAVPPRPMVDLPRPLEPRPTYQLQSSLSEASGAHRRPDAFRNPVPVQPEHRPPPQNLPRLHDILTSAPPAPSTPGYSSANGWSSNAGTPANPPSGEGYYRHTGWHPPLAPPPYDYHSQPSRHLELPILETSPVSRHDSHSVPRSPYLGYPDGSREYNGVRSDRARQQSTSSYLPNGAPSPYAPSGPEELQYRSPAASLDRPPSNYPPGAESSKKYIGVRDVPGEGTFHIYEGGFRIPTHVDGETVNPAWGLTKANKPRKRLAMACLDCREKKIKCEPGPASCLQCEKAKRPCRKAPAQQLPNEQSNAPVWQNAGGSGSPIRKGVPDQMMGSRDFEAEMASKRRTMEDASPSGVPTKKHRSASPTALINGSNGPRSENGIYHQASPTIARSPGRALVGEEDPYALEPEMTLHLLDNYFIHVNNATYSLFPRHHFMQWVMTQATKSPSERLVIFALLATGSIFADDRYLEFGKQCVNIVTDAVHSRPGSFDLALTQARLLLGTYHLFKGTNDASWDYIGGGISAAKFLRYNSEKGCDDEKKEVAEMGRTAFGFEKSQLIECKRRTMWTAFLMDRYSGTNNSTINAQDMFIRLPCSDEAYEQGLVSSAPWYNNGIIDPVKSILTASSEISPMAWLVVVAAIWSKVDNFACRAVHRSPMAYEEEYDKFYENTRTALQGWISRLPEHLQFSQANVERSIHGGYAGYLLSMHVLYHFSWLKMSRFVKHALILKSITRNVQTCHRHAHNLLELTSALRTAKVEVINQSGHQAPFCLTTPFAGYAILAAIDVVGAGGLDSHLKTSLDLISCGLECLRELGRYCSSARDQDKACEKRYYQIHNVLKHPFTARSGCWLGREWGVYSSLEREIRESSLDELSLEDDCIYGVSDREYFDALKDDHAIAGAGKGGASSSSSAAAAIASSSSPSTASRIA